MLTSKQRRKSHLAYDPKTYNISQSQQICVGIKIHRSQVEKSDQINVHKKKCLSYKIGALL